MKKAINRRRLAADRVTSRPRRTAARNWKLGETRRANKQKNPPKKKNPSSQLKARQHTTKKNSQKEKIHRRSTTFLVKKEKSGLQKKKRSRMETTGGTKQKKVEGKKLKKKIKMSERNGLSVRPQRGRVMTTTNESRNNKVKKEGNVVGKGDTRNEMRSGCIALIDGYRRRCVLSLSAGRLPPLAAAGGGAAAVGRSDETRRREETTGASISICPAIR